MKATTLQDLIQLTANKLSHLANQKVYYDSIGDVDEVARIEECIATTQITLNTLKSLLPSS